MSILEWGGPLSEGRVLAQRPHELPRSTFAQLPVGLQGKACAGVGTWALLEGKSVP